MKPSQIISLPNLVTFYFFSYYLTETSSYLFEIVLFLKEFVVILSSCFSYYFLGSLDSFSA